MSACIGMILAGGKGTRPAGLTSSLAKPAVPFGGKYRIIDFTLSNCANSGIEYVGVVTQYEPLVLHSHIRSGGTWGLSRDGIALLPPKEGCLYSGTADAVFQNTEFIEKLNPEHVLILSGDHVYRMDYNKMLAHHKEMNADVTISVMEVPWAEVSRFGLMKMDGEQRIREFCEKPQVSDSNLASMGVYIFKWETLKRVLKEDARKSESSRDFGKDIIPALVERASVYAFPFSAYWKNVGTVDSYWEAHMDLLDEDVKRDLSHKEWPIYTPSIWGANPQYIGTDASIRQSVLAEGCHIEGDVERSVLSFHVHVGKEAILRNSVLLPGSSVGAGTRLENVILASNVRVDDGVHLTAPPHQVQLITKHVLQENLQKKSV